MWVCSPTVHPQLPTEGPHWHVGWYIIYKKETLYKEMWLFWRRWKHRTCFSTQSEIWGWEKVTDSNHFSKMNLIDILKKKWMLSVQSFIFWNITRVLRPTVGCVGLPTARPHMPQKDTFAGYLSLPLKLEHPIWTPQSDLLIYFLQRFL